MTIDHQLNSKEIRELAGADGILQANEIKAGAEKYKVKDDVVPDVANIQANLNATSHKDGIALK